MFSFRVVNQIPPDQCENKIDNTNTTLERNALLFSNPAILNTLGAKYIMALMPDNWLKKAIKKAIVYTRLNFPEKSDSFFVAEQNFLFRELIHLPGAPLNAKIFLASVFIVSIQDQPTGTFRSKQHEN